MIASQWLVDIQANIQCVCQIKYVETSLVKKKMSVSVFLKKKQFNIFKWHKLRKHSS